MGNNGVTRIIGIDFGTSTTVVRVKRYQDGKPVGAAFSCSAVTFGNGEGDSKAVTAVRQNGDGTYSCGREAEDLAPEAVIYREFKMELESPDEEKRREARALTEEFFRYLYHWYDHQRSDMGEPEDEERTIVSFPVKWTEDTRDFMVEAAKKAGFPAVRSMDEPTAALYATLTRKMNDIRAKGLLRSGKPGYMLLIDMGAGTTDMAVCRYIVEENSGVIKAGQIKNEILATWPENADAPTFGGREVDRVLEGYVIDYLTACGLPPEMAHQLAGSANSVKTWKEKTVSPLLGEGKAVTTCGFLSSVMGLFPRLLPFPAIDRTRLEAMLKEQLMGFKSLVIGCLDKASGLRSAICQNGIDLVILTGGHSSWYFTEDLLTGVMEGIAHPALKRVQVERERVMRLSNPQETVALGMVYSLLPLGVKRPGEIEKERAEKEEAEEVERARKEQAERERERKEREERARKELEEQAKRERTEQTEREKELMGNLNIAELARQFSRDWTRKYNAPPFSWSELPDNRFQWEGRKVGYSIAVMDDGLRIENMSRKSNLWEVFIKWDILLSGEIRGIGSTVVLKRNRMKDTVLASLSDDIIQKHLLTYFSKLQEAIKGGPTAWPVKGTYTVIVTRKRQSGNTITVCVDQGQTYKLAGGVAVVITLMPGRHTFTLWFNALLESVIKPKEYPIVIDVDHDMDLTLLAASGTLQLREGSKVFMC